MTADEVWQATPPDKPGLWWMLSGECEGSPELVRVERQRGELWARDRCLGSLPVKSLHGGLTNCVWQEQS